MKTIGLIGGMSWESTAVYYRAINEAVRDRLGGLHSADIVLRSLDFERIVDLQRRDCWEEAGLVLGLVAQGLETAGADCILICTNTMHLVAEAAAAHCAIPLINIIDETARALVAAERRRPLLLATRYTMEHGFYRDRVAGHHDAEILLPDKPDRDAVHSIIFEELCRGIVTESSRRRLMDIAARGLAEGADSIILGCTELGLIVQPGVAPLACFDSTLIHAAAAVDFALSEVEP